MKISTKFMLPITTAIILLMSIILYLQIESMYNKGIKDLEEKAERIVSQIALTNALNAWEFFLEGTEENLDSFFRDKEIKKIEVFIVYQTEDENIIREREMESEIVISKKAEITRFGEYLGEVEIELAGDYLEQEIRDSLLKYISITIFILVIIIIIIVMTSKIVTKPIILVKNGFENLAEGNFDKKIELKTEDEIGEIATYFNEMVTQLREKIEMEKKLEVERENRKISKQWIEELKMKNDEIEKAYEDLKKAQEQMLLSEKMATLGRLVVGVSHEINTPLGICVTALSYFKENLLRLEKEYEKGELSEEFLETFLKKSDEITQLLITNVDKASGLIKSFKRVSVDQTGEERRELKLREYVKEIVTSLKPKLKTKIIDIQIDIDENLLLNTYPGDLSQVISNLIINSVIHGFENQEEGLIEISAKHENGNFILIYRDNGKGVDKKVRKKIFDPFYTTKRNKGGTGLGLYVTYNTITQKLKGKVKCKSEPGKGMTFEIIIPVREEDGVLITQNIK